MKLIYFLCLLTLISCSKKNALSAVVPPGERSTLISPNKEESRPRSSEFPLLSLGLDPSLQLELIDSVNGKVLNKELFLKPRNFIRSKMERMLFNNSSEVLTLEDLFKFEYFLDSKDRVKLFESLSFLGVTEYVVSAATKFKVISNEKKGLVRDISYKFSYFDGNRDAEISSIYEDLIRYENENEVIDLAKDQKKDYSVLSSRTSYSDLVNIFLTGKSLLYEIVDYKTHELSLREWSLKESSTLSHLLISTEKETLVFDIENGETIRSAIVRQAKSFEISQNSNIKEINGYKGQFLVLDKVDIDKKIDIGQTVAIYLNHKNNRPIFNTPAIYQESNSSEITEVQMKNNTVEFYIELSQKKYSLSYSNYYLPVRRKILLGCNSYGENCASSTPTDIAPTTCEVEATNLVIGQSVPISKGLENYIIVNLDGHSYPLSTLVANDLALVNTSGSVLHIIMKSFNSLNDYRQITLSTASTLEKTMEYRRSRPCLLIDFVQDHGGGGQNFGRMLDYIEGFSAMEREVLVGDEFKMNILSIK